MSLLLAAISSVTLAQESKLADTLSLEHIEIKATRASEKSPFTKTAISGAAIQAKNLGQDLPFLLTEVPGIVVNADAGNAVGYTGIRIRGTDASRINITLNGIPYNDAESQGAFFVDLPDFASSVGSIQVQRGVGTSSNGAGSFGATINMSTNDLRQKFYAKLESAGGSFNTWKHSFLVGSGLIGKHLTIDGRFSRINSDGYIDRAASMLKSFYTSAAWTTSSNTFRINFFTGKEKTYQAWYGVPENLLRNNRTYNSAGSEQALKPYENETDNYLQTHYQGFYNQKLNKLWNFQSAIFYSKGKGYYEQYKAGELFASYGLPDITNPNGNIDNTNLVRRLHLDNDFYGTVFSFQYQKKGNELTLGGGWNRYDGKHFGQVTWAETGIPANHRWYDLNANKRDFSLYGKSLQALSPHFFAFADLQIRNVVYNLNGFRNNPQLVSDNNYEFFNPKIGLTYALGTFKAFVSYAQANKEPNRDDFEAGTKEKPVPEKLHDIEVGVEKRATAYFYSATVYYMKYDNQLILTGKLNDVGAYSRTNIKDSYRAGVELEGKINLNKWFNVYANICMSTNRVKDFIEYTDDYDNGGQISFRYNKSDIALSPGVTSLVKLTAHPIKNAEVNLTGRYTGKQFLDNTSNNSRSLNSFFVQDLQLSYLLEKHFFRETSFVLQLNNIWNKKYEPNGYTYSYFYGNNLVTENFYFPMAGRNFMLGVKVGI